MEEISPNSAILVSGGSGFVGRHLVRRLSEGKNTIVAMYRNRLPEPMANVYPVCSDMSSPDLLLAPLRGVHTVVHLAWEHNNLNIPEKWGLDSTNLPPNGRITKNLLSAVEKSGVRRIIYLSTLGATRNATNAYLREKYLSEFLVLNSKVPEKLVMRTSMIYGEGGPSDRFLQSILGVMKLPGVYPVPRSKHVIAPISVQNVVDVIVGLIQTESSMEASILEVTGNEKLKVEDVFKIVSSKFVGKSKLAVKGFLGDGLSSLLEKDRKATNPAPGLRDFLDMGTSMDELTKFNNPMEKIVPKKMSTMKETLSKLSAPI